MPYLSLLSGFALLWATFAAQAADFVLRDELGQPLPDAVLLIDGDIAASEPTPVMDQIDMRFAPRVLVVPPGMSVSFPNGDDVRHHVYSFSKAKRFELRLFKGSEAPPVTFDEPGIVVLGCNIHDQMVGYILVTESPAYAVSNADGRARITRAGPGTWALSWWHPQLGEQPPVSLGQVALGTEALELVLPITSPNSAQATPRLSPLQQRFRKATHDAAH